MTKRFFRALLGGVGAAFTALLALSGVWGVFYLLTLIHEWGGTGAVALASVIIAVFAAGVIVALEEGE